ASGVRALLLCCGYSLLNAAVDAFRRHVRGRVGEPDALPFILDLRQVFRLVEQFRNPAVGIAACYPRRGRFRPRLVRLGGRRCNRGCRRRGAVLLFDLAILALGHVFHLVLVVAVGDVAEDQAVLFDREAAVEQPLLHVVVLLLLLFGLAGADDAEEDAVGRDDVVGGDRDRQAALAADGAAQRVGF